MDHALIQPRFCAVTPKQVAHFQAFGFVQFKQFFSADEMRVINAEFQHAMRVQYSHKPFDGTAHHWSAMLEGDTPFFAGLLEDQRFVGFARAIQGPDVLGIIADANRYVGNSAWHRDTLTVDQVGIKFAFYLDPLDAHNGALRVLPGSHAFPDAAPFNDLIRQSDFHIGEVPAHVCRSEPGDVVAFDLRTWHASLGGQSDRRMCTVVYYGNPTTPAQIKALLAQSELNPKIAFEKFGCNRRYLYSKSWMRNQAGNRDRQQWIDRLSELGYFKPQGVVEPEP